MRIVFGATGARRFGVDGAIGEGRERTLPAPDRRRLPSSVGAGRVAIARNETGTDRYIASRERFEKRRL